MQKSHTSVATNFLRWTSLLVMALLPFHALLTTWVGSNLGGLLIWRSWKEIVLLILLVLASWLVANDKKLKTTISNRLVNKLILVYVLWHVLVALAISRDIDALTQGLAINLRFLLFFIVVQIVVFYQPISKNLLYKILLIPGIGVVAFGLLQMFVLPKEFLSWFGYKRNVTIPPFFTIDEQLNQIRIASTLRGPNELGTYLVILTSSTVAYFLDFARTHKQKLVAVALITASLVALYGSHSRSAWLAAILASATWLFLKASKTQRAYLLLAGVLGFVILAGLTYQQRESNFVRDVILHDDPNEGGRVSSNVGHLTSVKSGIEDVVNKPLLGCGPGCAGPASVRHQDGANISESYYIQVAQETGLIGGVLFVAILVVVGAELYKKRNDNLALALLASLVGISAANLLLHSWADEIIAYLWWGSVAIVLYNQTKGKHGYNQKNQKAASTIR